MIILAVSKTIEAVLTFNEVCEDRSNNHCNNLNDKGVTVWVQNLLKVDFANLFVINMYLLTAFVTVFRSFANLNFVN